MSELIVGKLDYGYCAKCGQPYDEDGECPMTENDLRIDGLNIVCTIFTEV